MSVRPITRASLPPKLLHLSAKVTPRLAHVYSNKQATSRMNRSPAASVDPPTPQPLHLQPDQKVAQQHALRQSTQKWHVKPVNFFRLYYNAFFTSDSRYAEVWHIPDLLDTPHHMQSLNVSIINNNYKY
jgi:hypothetical protein